MNTNTGLIEKFIYSCSHDLRSPVSSIQGLVRIAAYYPQHEEIHKCLELIDRCTQKMDKLINSLQEFMTNGRRPLEIETVDSLKLIDEMKFEFKNQLDAYDIDFIGESASNNSWSADKYSIRLILKHLISNSISFHDPNKNDRKIKVRFETFVSGTTLEVVDNGKGISRCQQERIFDLFFKGSESSIGLGMGLFLARGLAEKMGGSITCKSTVSEGTSLQAFFPRMDITCYE